MKTNNKYLALALSATLLLPGITPVVSAAGSVGSSNAATSYSKESADLDERASAVQIQRAIYRLPAARNVTLENQGTIEAIREAYDVLSDEGKELVTYYNNFLPRENKLKVLLDETGTEVADQSAVLQFHRAIYNLPTARDIALNDAGIVENLRETYEGFSEITKELVSPVYLENLAKREEVLDQLELEEALAKAIAAVEKAEETLTNQDLIKARNLVKALDDSEMKTELSERLDAVEAQRKADRAAVVEAIEALTADSFELVNADQESAEVLALKDHSNGSTYKFVGVDVGGAFGYEINDDGIVINERLYEDKDLYFTFFIRANRGTAGEQSKNFSVNIPGSDLIGSNRGTIIIKDTFDEIVAERVNQSIQDLPTVEGVTLEDQEAVETARAAYDQLSSVQKEFVTELDHLEALEARLLELEEEPSEEVLAAIAAVEKAEETLTNADLVKARNLVKALEDSEIKTELSERLDAVEAERKANQAAAEEAIEAISADSFTITGADKETAEILGLADHPNGASYRFAGTGFGVEINEDHILINRPATGDRYFTFSVRARKGTGSAQIRNVSVSVPGKEYLGTNRGTIIVRNSFDEVQAARVDQSIQDLPAIEDVTLDDQEVVETVRAAYDQLSSGQKEFITELGHLEALEARLLELEETEPSEEALAAIAAVEKAEETLTNQDLVKARNLVKALDDSEMKTELSERLDAVEAQRKADQAAVAEAIEALTADSFELVGADEESATITLKDHPNGTTYKFAGAGSGFFGYDINDDGIVIHERYYDDQDLYFTFHVNAKNGSAGATSKQFRVNIPGSNLIGSNRGTIIIKDTFDEVEAELVNQSIQDLPAIEDVTLDDQEAVETVRAAYEQLSSGQKELVTELDHLEAVEARLSELKEGQPEIIAFKFDEGVIPGEGTRSAWFQMKNNVEGYETTFKGASFIIGTYSDHRDEIGTRYNGIQLAEIVVEQIEKRKTPGFRAIKESWDIKQEGSKVIFTSKENKPYDGKGIEFNIDSEGRGTSPIADWAYEVIVEQEGRLPQVD